MRSACSPRPRACGGLCCSRVPAARVSLTPSGGTSDGQRDELGPVSRFRPEGVRLPRAVAGAAANVGSVDRALEGRPGSWEAGAVRSLLLSTVGEDPAELL